MASRFDTYGKHKDWKGPSSYKKKTTSNKGSKTGKGSNTDNQKSQHSTTSRQEYEDKYLNLTKGEKQKNYQKYGNTSGYDPYKKSNKIKHIDTTGMDPKDAYRANQASGYDKQQKVNDWLREREIKRNKMEGRFKAGDPSLSKEGFREKIAGYKDGIFGLNFGGEEILTRNPITGEMERDKLRSGMSPDDSYSDYMSGLYTLNPPMMDKVNPAGTGALIEKLLTKGLGVPDYVAEGLASFTEPAREKLGDLWSQAKESDFVEDVRGLTKAPGEFINMLGGANNQFTAPQEVTERYINPAAGMDRFDDIFQEQEFDEYGIKPFKGLMPQLPETNVNKFGYKGSAGGMDPQSEAYQDMRNMRDFYNQGYGYNQGGIASLDVDFNSDPNYQALKQTNNYMGGF